LCRGRRLFPVRGADDWAGTGQSSESILLRLLTTSHRKPPPGDVTMIYLASPYSDPDPAVREQRFQAACWAAAALLRAGHIVFSPIVHCHVLVEHGLPTDWAFWQHADREHLKRCDEVVVLMLDGWEESAGVQAEIRTAQDLGKRVRYLAAEEAFVALTLAHVTSRAPI
jgi:nucleoside 2-deoxyribosyltransferase